MSDSDLSDDSAGEISSASDTSEDEELEEVFEIEIRPKNTDYFEHTIPQYNNEVFMEHFRVSRHVADSIADQLENSVYYKIHSGCYEKLPARQVIFIYLWFVGHQTTCFRDVADRFNVTISTLHRIIRRVTYFLSNLSPQIIQWPTRQEKYEIERHFRIQGFPGIIGAIDGSHIRIDKPSDDPDSYINRKSFYSIQLQLVCDHRLQIRDIFVRYPGSVHDSRVFRSSPLFATLQEKCGEFYLLGDSGYPLLPHLMTPFRDRGQLTRVQSNYNVKLAKNRYVIEHCFGLLKQKFRQLYHLKLRSIPDIVHFIRACCVLHNFALNDDVQLDEMENRNRESDAAPRFDCGEDDPDDEPEDRNAVQVRNLVVNMLSARLV